MSDHEALLKQRAAALRRALLAWFRREARDLPWRRPPRDPYRVWVSEIMLQQTRVEAVIPYYERFLAAFPDPAALAAAPDNLLLKLWEGLGYYARARNLREAARRITQERGGRLPGTAAEWAALPGVGRYTAGAIASIAFGERTPVVDGNVKRALARLFAIEEPVDAAAGEKAIWDLAGRLVPRAAPGDFNEAVMELGARVCLPRRPRCGECPVARWCEARRLGLAGRLPARRPRKSTPHYEIVAAALRDSRGRYLLGRRPPSSMLGGLWEFPGGKVEPGETHAEALARELREELGVEARVGRRIAAVDHAYSHFSITLYVYLCERTGGRLRAHWHAETRWVAPRDFARYPMPAADLKFLDRLT